MARRLLLFILVMGLPVLACRAPNIGDFLLPGTILFRDDFSDEDIGWLLTDADQGQAYYSQGTFRINVIKPDTQVWSNPGFSFTDVQVEVDALKTAGEDNNLFGLICRYQANKQFYAFVVSSDGYYGVLKYQQGNLTLLDTNAMLPVDHINQGNRANHLRFDCVADSLLASVNNHQIAQYQDSTFTSGDVGLIAGALQAGRVEIAFDDFFVLKP